MENNFTVKAYIKSSLLEPWKKYYYRFKYSSKYSQIGTFKTLPDENQQIEHIRFAILNCQDYSTGYFVAHKFLLEEEIDFVLFLGDYIYEYAYDKDAKKVIRKLQLPSGYHVASTEEDYHFLYNVYKSQKYLQELHRKVPFICIWDDHEYANDCYKYFAPDHHIKDENTLKNLRISANKAWFYNLPVNVPFNTSSYNSIQVYREFTFGNLLKVIITDERLFRSPHPCGEGKIEERLFSKGCGIEKNSDRTILGEEQLNWFFYQLENSGQRWIFWGNPVMFMEMKLDKRYITFDSWDGYQYERDMILTKIEELKTTNRLDNFVILTGDLHSFVAGYAKSDSGISVPEFITTSASSSNLDEIIPVDLDVDIIEELIKMQNKHIEYINAQINGYTIVDVYPEFTTITFKGVNAKDPNSNIKTLKTFRIDHKSNRFK